MGPRKESLDLARRIIADHPDLPRKVEDDIVLGYAIDAAIDDWIARKEGE